MLFFSIMIYSQITIKDLSISKINNKQKDTENANKVQVDEETIKRKKTVSKYFKHIDSSKDLTPDQAGYLLKAVYHKIDSLYLIKDSINSKAYSNKHSKNLDTVVINLNELSLAKEYLATINSLEGVPKISRKFVPIRSVYQANYFFMNSPNGESKINFVKDLSSRSLTKPTI